MKTLIIFDGGFDFSKIPLWTEKPDLLAITGDWALIESLETWCRVHRGIPSLLDGARLFDAQVHQLKTRIRDWSASMAETRIGHRTIKEWFLLPHVPVSAWWFSSFAERNNIKEDLFLRLAHVLAIERILDDNQYDGCVVSLDSPLMRKIFKKCVDHRGKKMVYREIRRTNLPPLFQRPRLWLDALGSWAHVFHAVLKFAAFVSRCWIVKMTMGPVGKRKRFSKENIVVTYYPYADREALLNNKFQNTYLLPLQLKIRDLGQKINWICLLVPVAHWTFRKSIRQARRLADAGESIFFLFEFMSIPMLFRCLRWWIRQTATSAYLGLRLGEDRLARGFQSPHVGPLLGALWRKSFSGWTGLEGILYFGMFSEMVKRYPEAARCIYCSEMQTWEKALNASKRSERWPAETLGFQHSAISKNHYFYFPSPEEVRSRGKLTDLPVPDVMAVNGKISHDYLSPLGFPRLIQLEAIRQMSLGNVLRAATMKKSGPVILFVGSYSISESRSLFHFLTFAWKDSPPCRVWFKPHPTMGWEQIIKGEKMSWPMDRWEVRLDPIDELLREAWIVVGGESSVSINALAHGCGVIAPVLNDVAFMNPLDGFDRYFEKVFTPEDFRKTAERMLKNEGSGRKVACESLVTSFWDLDPALSRWEAVLKGKPLHASP